jgi:hypothetical protein
MAERKRVCQTRQSAGKCLELHGHLHRKLRVVLDFREELMNQSDAFSDT